MAYKVIILYRLYMPSYFLGTFTEYPFLSYTDKQKPSAGILLRKSLRRVCFYIEDRETPLT